MAALHFLLSLTILLQVGAQQQQQQQAWPPNDGPCQPGSREAYNIFVRRHIRSDLPNTLDPNQWSNYIRKIGSCERPVQSFLRTSELDRVKAVCSFGGGAVYWKNLCISRQIFTFVTVRIEKGTCNIRSVRQETEHLILACDRVDYQCLPTHFERNRYNVKPINNAKGCKYWPRPQPTKSNRVLLHVQKADL